jgi:class 3 adenylate cyclase
MINKRTRAKLNRYLQERNEHPERSAELDARVWEDFGETLAVLVMDMSGFSRQTIRHGIIHFLSKIHRMHSIAIPAIESRDGVVFKLEADDIYAVFAEVGQAIDAALDIRKGLDAANTTLPDELDMHGEFGIGYGEILVIENYDIYGSEVNLASKLGEDLAERDEILVTESAFRQVEHNGRGFQRVSMSISGLDLSVYKVMDTAQTGSRSTRLE